MIVVVKLAMAVVLSWQIVGFVMKNSEDSDGELLSVVVMSRHGDKTPTTSFPNDPYFDISYWPMGRGQLTNKGKRRHYDLGKWLRTRYSSFLPEQYSPKDIYVRSVEVDRALMSAAANLAGLYPPKDEQIWLSDLLWQPIPIHSMPKQEDQVLNMKRNCPKYNKLYDEIYNAQFFRNINEQYAEFYKDVSSLTGWNITDIHYFAQLQSVLSVYTQYNASYLPAWASYIDMKKVNYLAGLNYARFTFTDDLKRLVDGPFNHYLLSTLDKMLSNSSPKFLMISARETTLASVLNGMGAYDYEAPEFASCVIWEVRKNATGDQYVRLFYRKNNTSPAEELQIKECGYKKGPGCSYKSFKDALEPMSVDLTTWVKECEAGAIVEPVMDGKPYHDPGSHWVPGANWDSGANGEVVSGGEAWADEGEPGCWFWYWC